MLAVPNGMASAWAGAIVSAHPGAVVIDLSADHRFSNSWAYGLPERYRDEISPFAFQHAEWAATETEIGRRYMEFFQQRMAAMANG